MYLTVCFYATFHGTLRRTLGAASVLAGGSIGGADKQLGFIRPGLVRRG